jgi:putative oxidoreductase
MGQLHNLSVIVPDFVDWPIHSPQILAPFFSGVECFGGMFLLTGFLTRISAGAGAVSVDRWINCFTLQAQW